MAGSKKGLEKRLAAIREREEEEQHIACDRLAFALELQTFLDGGGHERLGYPSPWAYILAEVCPKLGWDKGKVARLLMAAREYRNVVAFRPGARGPLAIKTLSMLHTERRRQIRGAGRVDARGFRQLERRVAAGKVSKREMGEVLRCAA